MATKKSHSQGSLSGNVQLTSDSWSEHERESERSHSWIVLGLGLPPIPVLSVVIPSCRKPAGARWLPKMAPTWMSLQ